MSEQSSQKTALITGASRGLGHAMAVELARANYHILALARTQGALDELADAVEKNGSNTTLIPLDLTDHDGLARAAAAISERWGGLDMLVHAAIHAAPLAPSPQNPDKDFDRSIAINVTATHRLIRAFAPLMRQDGKLLFFDDPAAGRAFHGSYGSSKKAQIALAQSWQEEAKRVGPEIHILTPKPMPTALRARFHPGEDRAALTSPADEAKRLLGTIF